MDAAPPAWQRLLDETLAALRAELGSNLHSVVLYGSAARDEFVAGRSDLNLLIVLERSDPAAHEALARALRPRPQVEPFAIGRGFLPRTVRSFPAKFAAIRRSGRVVHGPDPLAGLPHHPELERYAAEQALRNVRLRLVYNFTKHGGDPKAYTRFLKGYLGAVFSAANAALELEGIEIPRRRRKQAEMYDDIFRTDTWVLSEIIELKEYGGELRADQVSDFHARLFAVVMAMLDWVEERWPV